MALWLSLAWAGALEDGAAAFQEGDLDAAIAAWQSASAEGAQPSGVLQYNLGVAWYRKGDFPRAVAELRGAARLRPRDGNVLHNLALARAALGMVPTPVSDSGWTQVVTAGEVSVLGVLITALGSLLLSLGHRPPMSRLGGRAAGGLLLALGLALGLLGVSEARWQRRHPVAVVLGTALSGQASAEGPGDDVVVRDAPSINAGERHRWPAGTETRVIRSHDGFLLLEDGRQRRGWVASNSVELAW